AFNWRVAREMHKRKIPVVYYVCPQFWAWRQGRVKLLRDYVDQALVIFPFEEKFYRDRGVNTTFVGHPLSELPPPSISRGDYAHQQKLDPAKQWITIMPGSRMKEVRMNLPAMLESVRMLGNDYEFLLPIAPTLDRGFIFTFIGNAANIYPVPESLPALYHSRAGIIASGTATVEAAMLGLPFVMVYRVSKLTYLLGKSTVKVPHFAMVNLIAGERIVPELIQHDFTAANVVSKIREILPDGPPRVKMLADIVGVKTALQGPLGNTVHPAEKAAEIILNMLQKRVSGSVAVNS
ncbi:MAG TPA: lipid-A-disaccharide synthase, partial [Terriglobales bacterium]